MERIEEDILSKLPPEWGPLGSWLQKHVIQKWMAWQHKWRT